MSHRHVSANVRAFVDEEIKELIELLNTFDNVCTYMTCQDGAWGYAYIHLYYGTDEGALENTWKDYLALTIFAKKLADAISPVLEETGGHESPLYSLRMSIKWWHHKECAHFIMEMPPSMIAEITRLFYKVKKEFDNSKQGKKDINLSALITELS